MKYWNKDKAIRQKWATAPAPNIRDVKEAKRWCQQNESSGKFYCHYTNTRWWFEKDSDATFFALKWGSKGS